MSFIPEDVKLEARAKRDSMKYSNQLQQLNDEESIRDDQQAKQNQIFNEQRKINLNDRLGF